jgi:hypothetical protein
LARQARDREIAELRRQLAQQRVPIRHRKVRRARRLAYVSVGLVGLYTAVGGVALASPGGGPASVYSSIAPVNLHTATLAANHQRDLTVAGIGSVPADASSVQLSFAAVDGAANSYLSVYATGAAKPSSANIRWQAGQTVTDPITVAIGTGGQIHIYNGASSVEVKVSAVGYFAPVQPEISLQTTYHISTTSSDFLWSSMYEFQTSPASYTEYFTRYYDWSVPAITPDVLENGTVQVYFTPNTSGNTDQWAPLPYELQTAAASSTTSLPTRRPTVRSVCTSSWFRSARPRV